ncbi:MAG: Glutamine synthetase [Firmicutes bacterium ADurb.Bin248]|nr:MAG: Glutamine synthetase [Firmicutes bacterium ADurb.Bin248]HOG00084.1 glutamine synthetase III [Clostridia bacterium]HPK16765.1 glutamine synthetase III [Clostridia bacterium]
MESIAEFGSMVFGEAEMKRRLPEETFEALRETIRRGRPLGRHIAGPLANAMKEWALEKGATHFTHWFQPLTGVTAEKHDSFIAPGPEGGAIAEFSGRELVMGEPDASSFPSGGLRATFEARGYTAWDPTSFAFIKDGTLCIPSVFCSYGGDALDKKMPLLRSVELIERETLRLLRAYGVKDVSRVTPTVGAEQEYFLVDAELCAKRRDLVLCGRTLFGAQPAKSQELDDHYYGAIEGRVQAFMRELDGELWKLGVYARTEHKEVAPGQYELAPFFCEANVATDHNQLTMELLRRIAPSHGFVCLLHEKPFAGLNGSGKHNNWSLMTDTGVNLLSPGKTPAQNTLFLLVLSAVIKAVDLHQDLIRLSIAGASNDLRLGRTEAPPAIVSVFIGEELTAILEAAALGNGYDGAGERMLESGIKAMPRVRMDNTDRNRTAPFAFTGNKFEFRMPGASHSIADANTVINTIAAEAFADFAEALEKAEDPDETAKKLIVGTVKAHGRILFGGNCYAESWKEEAARRGLVELKTTLDALPRYIAPENVALFTRHGIFSERELRSRYEVSLESYAKITRIEARTMLEMARREIIPACSKAQRHIAEAVNAKSAAGAAAASEKRRLLEADALLEAMDTRALALEKELARADAAPDSHAACVACRDGVIPAMAELREAADALEQITASSLWPFPVYEQLLMGAR